MEFFTGEVNDPPTVQACPEKLEELRGCNESPCGGKHCEAKQTFGLRCLVGIFRVFMLCLFCYQIRLGKLKGPKGVFFLLFLAVFFCSLTSLNLDPLQNSQHFGMNETPGLFGNQRNTKKKHTTRTPGSCFKNKRGAKELRINIIFSFHS